MVVKISLYSRLPSSYKSHSNLIQISYKMGDKLLKNGGDTG